MKLSKGRKFVRLIQQAGWSQAETARRLHITPGAVSQICTGRTQPRTATLNLLQLMVNRGDSDSPLHSNATGPLMPWEAGLVNELRRVPLKKREALLAAFRPLIRVFSDK